ALNRHLRAGLDVVAVDVTERDRRLQRRRPRTAGHPADLPLSGANARAGRRHHVTLEPQPDEPARHAAMTPVENADDDLLADVASLAEADGARFDACLERNRLLVHVTMKQRSEEH